VKAVEKQKAWIAGAFKTASKNRRFENLLLPTNEKQSNHLAANA